MDSRSGVADRRHPLRRIGRPKPRSPSLCHPSWLVRRSKRLCGSGREEHYALLETWLKCQSLRVQGALVELRRAGHDVAQVTLHIGYGTWKSLATEYVDEHDMDAEFCEMSTQTLATVRAAKAEGRPVVAVGTSSVRTLETFASEILSSGLAEELRRETKLFIAPPFHFGVVNHMITNFAYPQTPIMALTAAFAGSTELLFGAYQEAVGNGDYLFFSYGDGMFLR